MNVLLPKSWRYGTLGVHEVSLFHLGRKSRPTPMGMGKSMGTEARVLPKYINCRLDQTRLRLPMSCEGEAVIIRSYCGAFNSVMRTERYNAAHSSLKVCINSWTVAHQCKRYDITHIEPSTWILYQS
jgi:hypothetical protein